MKISETWLKEWVNTPLSGVEIANQLTMAGLEVDARIPVAGKFDNVIVAKVVTTKKHPNADKLTVCEVSIGDNDNLKQIVCGALNVRPNLIVALAQPSAKLPNGMVIKEAKLRGELSQGMLCSSAELGLQDESEGIMELDSDAPLGMTLREYLDLDDHILDIDLTPNRADCMSVLGIAREVSALNDVPLNKKEIKQIELQSEDSLSIDLKAPKECSQYCGRIIRDINPNALTPTFIKERLRRAGLRSLHPVVDITNYVMLELGQPMHAFDFKKLTGAISVRFSNEGETLELLDGQNIKFTKPTLLISDNEKPLAIAGIMGGKDSAVSENTHDIFIESAFFAPINIATTARFYNLNTDSSQRFERGVDPGLQILALQRATELLSEIVGGKVGPITLINEPQDLPQQKNIYFNPQKVEKITGAKISEEKMLKIFHNLNMKVSPQENLWHIVIPTYRFDLQYEADLVEEIIRLYGYDNLPVATIEAPLVSGASNFNEKTARKISNHLKAKGFNETISYSFVDPALQEILYPENKSKTLINPISVELSVMRVGLWPGLIASMLYNLHRQQDNVRFFETGVVYDIHETGIIEKNVLGGLIAGMYGELNWLDTTRQLDFYDLKGELESLFQAFNMQHVQFQQDTHPALHPGKTARIVLDAESYGWIGVLHPRIADLLSIDVEVVLFEFDLSLFKKSKVTKYNQISKYPRIRRDLSFLVAKNISASQIKEVVLMTAQGDNLLKEFDIFDVYTGKNIPEDKKSFAIALTLQDDQRTLIDAEVNLLIDNILKDLTAKYSIILRDQ